MKIIADHQLLKMMEESTNGMIEVTFQWGESAEKEVEEERKEDPNVCPCCRKDGKLLCGRCRKVRYCSPECQKDDWKRHKIYCK